MQRTLQTIEQQRWLRRSDIDFLKALFPTHPPGPPAPPANTRSKRKLEPITWLELAPLLASYNAFVRLWNVHERDDELMLSPTWWDGSTPGHIHPNRLVICRNDGSRVEVQLDLTWSPYFPGLSGLKNEVPFDRIEWAGKSSPRQ